MPLHRIVRSVETSPGWVPRLRAKGYEVLTRPMPFGRTKILVKKDGYSLSFDQALNSVTYVTFPSDDPVHLKMIADLDACQVLQVHPGNP